MSGLKQFVSGEFVIIRFSKKQQQICFTLARFKGKFIKSVILKVNFVQAVRIKLRRLQLFGLLYHNRFRKKCPKLWRHIKWSTMHLDFSPAKNRCSTFFSFSLNGGFEHRLTDRRRRRRHRTFSHTRKKVGRLGERKNRCTKKWGNGCDAGCLLHRCLHVLYTRSGNCTSKEYLLCKGQIKGLSRTCWACALKNDDCTW